MDTQKFDLDHPLIHFNASDGGNTPFTIRDAVEGVAIFGSNGSGKSSGSARAFALKYLSYGMGGLILTVKVSEKATWMKYLEQTNRLDDLILVEPGGKYHFNLLEYLGSHRPGGLAISENIAALIETILESNDEKNRGQASDPFWQESLHMTIVHLLDLLLLAYDAKNVSIRTLYDIALTVPKRGRETEDKPKPYSFDHAFQVAKDKVKKQAREFVKTLSEAEKEKLTDDEYYDRLIIENIPDAALFRSLDQFFNDHYKNLAEKTKSIVEFSFLGLMFRFLREPIYSLFTRHTCNFKPEDSLQGKVILINLPTKIYDVAGRLAQVAFKHIWQMAMERRNIQENARPVFLFADEAQEFLTPHDSAFQATARSSRICTVYITQSLGSYHGNMGGIKAEHKVLSFMATLGTKIFHNNSHIETNNWASDLIGFAYVEDESRGTTVAGNFSSTRNTSYKLEKMFRPEEFNGLKSGGPTNGYLVEGIMHRQNNPFHDGLSFRKITFKQN